MFKLDLEKAEEFSSVAQSCPTLWPHKGRGTRDQIANICWIIERQESSRKTLTSALLTMPKPLTVWSQQTVEILQDLGIQTTVPASWEICSQLKKQQLELYMEQQTDSKLGKEYIKAIYCHPAYLAYMQIT